MCVCVCVCACACVYAGQDKLSTKMTSQMIGQRLMAEAETNIGIKVKQSTERAEAYDVMGRGELQLGILVENMRREGFELGVCPPKVLYKKGEGGERLEPIEEVVVEVDDEFSGAVINKLSERKVREHCHIGFVYRLQPGVHALNRAR